MTYAGGSIHTGSRDRAHAMAPRSFLRSVSMNSRCFNGMMLSPSSSASSSNRARKKRLPCFREIERRCARTSLSCITNSTVTRGSSSAVDGGTTFPFTDATPVHALPGGNCSDRCFRSPCKRNVTRHLHFTVRCTSRIACADGSGCGGCPQSLASSRSHPFPHKEKAGSTGPSLFPILRGQPSQGCRRISVLRQRSPFAAVRASQVFVGADQNSPCKVHPDHVAHLSVLKSAEPVRPVAVSLQ